MARQRLRKGWVYNASNDAAFDLKRLHILAGLTDHFTANDGVRCIGVDGPASETIQQCPVDVALALIRNADLDPIFEAARRLRDADNLAPGGALGGTSNGRLLASRKEALEELKRLIDESEEPDTPTAPETSP